jgi:hypothetical protein
MGINSKSGALSARKLFFLMNIFEKYPITNNTGAVETTTVGNQTCDRHSKGYARFFGTNTDQTLLSIR